VSEKGGRERDVGGGAGRVAGMQGLQGVATHAVSRTHTLGTGVLTRSLGGWLACCTRAVTCATGVHGEGIE